MGFQDQPAHFCRDARWKRLRGYLIVRKVVCSGHEEAIALYSCEEKSKEGCMIYAHEGKYVWNGEKVE